MKRGMTFLFAACVAWCVAAAANAETITIYCTDSGGSVAVGTVNASRNYNATYGLDKVEFKLNSWLLPSYSGAEINVVVGKWSVSPSTISLPTVGIYLSNPATYDWRDDTSGWVFHGVYYTPDPPQSYVNVDLLVSNAVWSRTASAASPIAGHMYSDFHGGWYTSSSTYNIGVGETLAVLYVTPNANVTFTAAGTPDAIGTTKGSFMKCTFATAIPEPSTLALLAAGLAGLLAYAWRKRK